MNGRILAFSARNRREILRDPLSYIFCLAFPLVMLAVMSLVNASIPPQAGVTVFRIESLCPGVAVFGQTFVMLFTALTVSTDRSGSFLVRLYTTPMKPGDFIAGYTLPSLAIAMGQTLLVCAASLLVSLITGEALSPLGLLASLPTLLPSAVMFIGLGLLAGTLFGVKSAPGICSVVISLGSFLGGIWFDAESAGGVMLTVCKCLPFYYCTRCARSAVRLDFGLNGWLLPLLIVTACAAAAMLLASLVFRARMKTD